MNLSVLKFKLVDQVAVVNMNHPPVNALGIPFLDDFYKVLNRLNDLHDARAVVITSDCPDFFSAGDDLHSLRRMDQQTFEKLPRAHALLDLIETLPLPTVAAINGHALGGGLELAMVCDFRFMGADSGLVGLPEVRLGLIPALGGTQRLTRLVGKAKAIEMMFKGLQLTPAEAQAIGLVTDVYPQEELYARSLDYAARLSRQATAAIARIKRCVHTGLNEGLRSGLKAEIEAFKENIASPDAKEGVAAFLEGRKPRFKG